MKQDFIEKIFIGSLLAVPLLVIFATEKVVLFGIPLYAPEVFTIFALGSLLMRERSVCFIHPRMGILFLALFLIAVGLGIGALSNDTTLHGYGRMKSWFVFPLLYGSMLAFSLRRNMLSREDIFRSVFFGGILVGMATFVSIFSGGGFSYDHRLHGFFSSPNQLALLLGTALIIGVFLAISLWGKPGKERLTILFGVLFLGMLLLLTQSYTVLFSLMMVAGIGIARYRHRFSRRQVVIFSLGSILCVGILLTLSYPKWQSIITSDERSSIASRGMIWQSALQMIREHPLIGIGPGNFQREYIAYQQYFPPYLEWSAPHPHNAFLDLWLEGGLFAVIGFALFFWHWLASSARDFFAKKKEDAVRALPFFLGIYFFLTGLTDVSFLGNDLAYFFTTAFVLSLFLMRESTDVSDRLSHHGD
ncbi:MAG: O-antigen ligase family protein [Candidatus Moraniibacteriota bacterium]